MVSDHLQLPTGFRFHPTDEELIVHYLMNKVTSNPLPASIVADLDLYKFNPWDLPDKALFGKEEWYFFTPRERKYPNGARPNRGAASGYWKATGTDKSILTASKSCIGVKKALVFYKGRSPKGMKTEWIMHEYRLLDPISWTPKRKGSMRLDDWVLCRVKQRSCISRSIWEDQNGPVSEQPSYNTKLYEHQSIDINPNVDDTIKYSVFNDCPMLPFIFAGHENIPKLDPDPYTSFQSRDKHWQVADNLFSNQLKRKLETSNQQHSKIFVAPSKNRGKEDRHEREEIITITNVQSSDVNLCATGKQFDGNNISPEYQWDSIIQYQELSDITFCT